MSQIPNTAVAVIGIDIGKNSFHVVGHDARGAIVLRQKWSRGHVEAQLGNMQACLIGMEARVGAHHLSGKRASLGHDARLMPTKYVHPYLRRPPHSIFTQHSRAQLPRLRLLRTGDRKRPREAGFPSCRIPLRGYQGDLTGHAYQHQTVVTAKSV